MLRLLRTLSWRHVQRHRLRTLLTFLGITLGVGVIVAIAVVNRSLTGSFQSTIEKIAGKAVLQVSNGESGIIESAFPVIRDTAGVQDAAAAVEGFLPVRGAEKERLYLYGVDLLTDTAIREHRFVGAKSDFDQALDFISRPDSIALTESFSRRLNLPLGTKITLTTSRGKQDYTVRALLREEGMAKVFGGNLALMDLPVAQQALGKEGKLDIVDLTVEEGEKIEAVKERLVQRLQGAAEVERPRKRGEQIELLLTSFRVGLFFVSLIALFVGFFLIYNTVSVSVIQRKREIGTLRCLGMKRGELLRWIVVEALDPCVDRFPDRQRLRMVAGAARARRGWRDGGESFLARRPGAGDFHSARAWPGTRQRPCRGGSCRVASRVGSDSGKPPGKCQANRLESFISRKKVLGDPARSLLSGRFSRYPFSAVASSRTRATVQCGCHWNVGVLAWPRVSLPSNHQLWSQMVLAMGVTTARLILD